MRNLPEKVRRPDALGSHVVGNTPDAYRSFQPAEIESWRRVVQTANIRAD